MGELEQTGAAEQDAAAGQSTAIQSGADAEACIEEKLQRAQEAYEANDSTTVSNLCGEVLDVQPENVRAWSLLAKFGGWDAKMLKHNMNLALNAITRALELTPEEARYSAATEIYTARKRQISERLEECMMMPSYQGTKNLHAVMLDWQRFLVEIPHLSPALLEEEITLCDNLCLRSKMGIMPNDRVVYSAYATFNKKETYGDMFRRNLANRLQRERQLGTKALEEARQQAESRLADYRQRAVVGSLAPGEEKKLLLADIAEAEKERQNAIGISGKEAYEQQIAELRRQQAALKPYKLVHRKRISDQIDSIQEHIKQADAQLEVTLQPWNAQLEAFQARLAELEGEPETKPEA